jgi:hypothetical protein
VKTCVKLFVQKLSQRPLRTVVIAESSSKPIPLCALCENLRELCVKLFVQKLSQRPLRTVVIAKSSSKPIPLCALCENLRETLRAKALAKTAKNRGDR